jgi:hypothetical protein
MSCSRCCTSSFSSSSCACACGRACACAHACGNDDGGAYGNVFCERKTLNSLITFFLP